jgi:hypothetical protein
MGNEFRLSPGVEVRQNLHRFLRGNPGEKKFLLALDDLGGGDGVHGFSDLADVLNVADSPSELPEFFGHCLWAESLFEFLEGLL